MAESTRVYALSVLSLFILLLFTLYSRYKKLSHVPGPLFTSFTDLWRAYYQNSGDFPAFSLALHAKYGPVVRVGPNTVHVGKASALPTIYTNHGEFQKVAGLDISTGSNSSNDS